MEQAGQWRLDLGALMMPDTIAGNRHAAGIRGELHLERERAGGVLSLLYAAGERPGADDVARLLEGPTPSSGQGARISHRPAADVGWLELLASGLTFEVSGLTPAEPQAPPSAVHLFGLSDDIRATALDAVSVAAGAHLAEGATMLPVVRVMLGLCARLVALGNVRAISWQPAQSWMEPDYFARMITGWIEGGAFPALGLTTLERTADGGLESRGLDFFIGQELRFEAQDGEAMASAAKLAVRVIDFLVRHGGVRELTTIPGSDGEMLLAEPSHDGKVVSVWRGA